MRSQKSLAHAVLGFYWKNYWYVPPTKGGAIPINVDPTDVKDDTPLNREIRNALRKLQNGRVGGGSKMKAEDAKGWLGGVL